MQVKAESYGHAVILNCKGELTADALEAFGQVVTRNLGENVRDVVFHLAEVPFIDSAALEYMLDLQERLAERLGQVCLVGLDENLMKIIEITRLEGSFQMFREPAEAMRSL